jgi:hypothetical protein
LFSLLLSGFSVYPESNRVKLKIPVRFMDSKIPLAADIQKTDFTLFINNQPVPITDINPRNISLSDKSKRRRHFFLSFQVCSQDRTLTSIISHFLTGILNQTDSLHILSPVKTHTIPVSENKGAILNRINQIINSECLPFSRTRQIFETKIENEIQQFRKILRDSRVMTIPRLFINRFIENLSHVFLTYRKEFLTLDMLRYQDPHKLFLNLEGDCWWFHIQQNRTFDFINRLNLLLQSLRPIRFYPLLKTIGQIQNNIKPSTLVHFDLIRELMVENQIRFHVLITDDVTGSQAGIAVPLEKICLQSGGTYSKALSPSAALDKIKNHQDSFFEITCHVSADPEPKQVRIMSDYDPTHFVYKNRFSVPEIAALLKYQTETKITISSISVLKNKISFLLSDYKINTEKGFGLIKIRLNFTTTGDKIIHSTENILRASKHQIRVSVPLPIHPEPVLNLNIIASDILDNHCLQTHYQVFFNKHNPLILPMKSLK